MISKKLSDSILAISNKADETGSLSDEGFRKMYSDIDKTVALALDIPEAVVSNALTDLTFDNFLTENQTAILTEIYEFLAEAI